MGSQLRPNNFKGHIKSEGIATNREDLNMKLENISRAQCNNFLRYSISQNNLSGSQHHLEVALATTNLDNSMPNAKQRKPSGEEGQP